MGRTGAYFLIGTLATAAALFVAWATAPNPKFNQASFEDQALVAGLAPLDEAITLAQFRDENGATATIAVTGFDDERATGIDLTAIGAPMLDDPFAVLAAINPAALRAAVSSESSVISLQIKDLIAAGPVGAHHIGIGTNFPEHAQEASSSSVFIFPKFGTATPARTSVAAPVDGLLDYEVELCMRFDRPISTIADFDAAVKGIFLCGDFTERTALLKLADPDNLNSGFGFSDAKSGAGFFPTGPFLVVPNDWSSFIQQERMTTELNGKPRQDARGGEMILNFRALADKALNDMDEPRFFYKDAFYKLTPNDRIDVDMTLMSGTSEGVIFTLPTRRDYIEIVLGYALEGGPLSGKSLREFGMQAFIEKETASRHFLQAGDVVVHRSSRLGEIIVQVTD